jgi:hypothetical protein
VLVSDLDVQCALWLKLRLAPMCPWIGTISLAFVGPPAVKVQLSPYNRVRLMRIPVLQVRALDGFRVALPSDENDLADGGEGVGLIVADAVCGYRAYSRAVSASLSDPCTALGACPLPPCLPAESVECSQWICQA